MVDQVDTYTCPQCAADQGEQQVEEEEEEAYCFCGTDRHLLSNSLEFEGMWLSCDHCELWCHAECTGVAPEMVDQVDMYTCPRCLRSGDEVEAYDVQRRIWCAGSVWDVRGRRDATHSLIVEDGILNLGRMATSSGKGPMARDAVLIHFQGWSQSWDEWVSRAKWPSRLRPPSHLRASGSRVHLKLQGAPRRPFWQSQGLRASWPAAEQDESVEEAESERGDLDDGDVGATISDDLDGAEDADYHLVQDHSEIIREINREIISLASSEAELMLDEGATSSVADGKGGQTSSPTCVLSSAGTSASTSAGTSPSEGLAEGLMKKFTGGGHAADGDRALAAIAENVADDFAASLDCDGSLAAFEAAMDPRETANAAEEMINDLGGLGDLRDLAHDFADALDKLPPPPKKGAEIDALDELPPLPRKGAEMERHERYALEATVGYCICGINGCILTARHGGDCIFTIEAGGRRRRASSGA